MRFEGKSLETKMNQKDETEMCQVNCTELQLALKHILALLPILVFIKTLINSTQNHCFLVFTIIKITESI